MSGSLPPLYELTADNRGAIVVVVGYSGVLISILLAAIRVVSVVLLKRTWSWDDASLLSATVLALVQTIMSEKAVDSGLGMHIDKVDAKDLSSYHKFSYTAHLLALVIMALAKVSVLILILRLSPGERTHRACRVSLLIVLAWTIFSLFGLAFQCNLPQPWVYDPSQCAGQGALWYPIVAFNVLTDFVIAALFIPTLLNLQMPLSRKLAVCLVFGSRIVVCGVGIAQLIILPEALQASDQTWSTVNLEILIQLMMNLSIITAIIPSLARFFSELQIGHGARLPDNHEELYGTSSSQRYELSNISHSARTHHFTPADGPQFKTTVLVDAKGVRPGDGYPSDHGVGDIAENRRCDGLRQRLIDGQAIRTWEVTYETEDASEAATQRSEHSQVELKHTKH